MTKKYLKLVISIDDKSQDQIDLAQVLIKLENVQQAQLDLASVNYHNPLVNTEYGTIGGGKFFSKQLAPVVANARPTTPFYWFKKLYEFYQEPANKSVTLKSAIDRLIGKCIKETDCSYEKISAFYFKLFPENPLAEKFLSEINALHSKKMQLEEMPVQLIALAEAHGFVDKEPTESLSK